MGGHRSRGRERRRTPEGSAGFVTVKLDPFIGVMNILPPCEVVAVGEMGWGRWNSVPSSRFSVNLKLL